MVVLSSLLTISGFLAHLTLSNGQGCNLAQRVISPLEFSQLNFHYVIIGGGTAGLAIASRLSENPALQVGVIEAGNLHEGDPLIDVPQNMGVAFSNPDYDWNFVTVPQEGAANRSIAATRGKILGGSSALNFLAWTRASKEEYDSWQSFVPGSTWNWGGLLPYFKKATTVFLGQTNPFLQGASEHDAFSPSDEGFSGPIHASFNDVYPDPVSTYIETVNSLGIKTNADPDNGNTTGLTNCRSSIDRIQGKRSYAAPAYYCPSAGRKNLHVLTNAQATKVLLSPEKKGGQYTANAVQFATGSVTYIANVKLEVILSAGVYQSPQLLELSGIGNKTLLERIGIQNLINLPSVGENLQDHLGSEVQYNLKPGILTFDELRNNITFKNEQSGIYNRTGGGLLAASNSILAFVTLPSFLNRTTISRLRNSFDQSTSRAVSPLQQKQFAIQRQWLAEGTVPQFETILFSSASFNPQPNQSYITIITGQLHHVNRGNVHINSSNPLAPPVINPGWLDNDFDLSMGITGIKLSTLIGSTKPLSGMIHEMTDPPSTVDDDVSLTQFFRETVGSFDHPMGVVDAELKVYGTTNLRVCDASIIPMGVGTHLQSTVYAIAEKLADMILGLH